MEQAHALSGEQILQHFSASEYLGLSEAQVQASRDKHGRNGGALDTHLVRYMLRNI